MYGNTSFENINRFYELMMEIYSKGRDKMTRFVMIRHGESEANRLGLFAGQIDPDLQSKGLEQAELTAKYVAENFKIDKIYSSDLKRAHKTGMCLAQEVGLDVIIDTNLREIDGGEWENIKFADLLGLYPKEYSEWMADIGSSACPGGEAVKDMGARVMNELKKIAMENPGKTIAIATHATPIRAVQSIISCGSTAEMKNIPWVSNASVTVVECDDNDNWNVVRASIDEHLADLITVLPAEA